MNIKKTIIELKAFAGALMILVKKRPFVSVIVVYLFIVVITLMFEKRSTNNVETQTTEAINNEPKIPKGFSGWDGSNLALVNLVKENMNDDDSFEHLETKLWTYDSFYIVRMKYKGKNQFNATVKETVKAKISKEDGSVLEVLPN